jgi:flagellar hook protein FlgE
MSFGIALSGIDAAQSDLNVTANNIANSSTTGYKSSTSEFAELFAVNGSGVSKTQAGNGVALTDIAQNFKQGNISTTGNNLDLAISGDGFFVLRDTSGNIDYSRAGSFQTDANNYVVNAAGQHLQVYPLTSTGTYNTTTLQNLQLTNAASAPAATTAAQTIFNLPSNATQPVTAFSPTDASTYNQTTTLTVYDSLGAAHTASIYFVKGTTAANASNWNAYEYIDGTAVNAPVAGVPQPLKLVYNGSGVLSSVTNPGGATPNPQTNAASFGAYTPTTGAAALNVSFDFSKSTQYGSTFSTTSLTQDGYTTGTLSGISVGTDGVVQANFTNGQSLALGKVAIATFANTQGLQQVANTNWVATYASGTPLYGQAGQGGAGNIQSGALEDSNVDLTAQLVNMIQAQRNFQANAQVITTENQVTQSIINIR